MIKIFLIFSLIFFCKNIFAYEKQFICEFTKEIKISGHPKSPDVAKASITERYSFFKNGNNASYINLKYGEKLPVFVIDGIKSVNFVENSASDNLFLVTIFYEGSKKNSLNAIKSVHASDMSLTAKPSQSYGTCSMRIND